MRIAWTIVALTALLTAASSPVCASGCNMTTILIDGRATICQTCCVMGNCTTVCSP